MRTDTEISYDGFTILFRRMDMVEAERFITLVQRDHFDYTTWRESLLEDLSLDWKSSGIRQIDRVAVYGAAGNGVSEEKICQ